MTQQDFVDRIVQGFESLRDRAHFDYLAAQFDAGEISFVVDQRGIRIVAEDEEGDLDTLD